MEICLEEPIDLAEVAGAAGLSPSHFARMFRSVTRLAPHQYLMGLRIRRAARLLAETETPVIDIAFACGFSN